MIFVGLLLLVPPPADALKRAEAYYAEAQYADAVAALDELSARADLSVAERRETTLYLGMAHLALGHEEAARARFREVLEGDESYALPRYTSPKIRTVFEEVRAEVRARPVLAALPAETTPAPVGPEHVKLRFRADRLGGAHPVIRWRRAGQVQWAQAEGLAVEPPLAMLGADADFDLEYYAEVRGGSGQVLSRAGSPEHPLRLRVPVHAPQEGPPPAQATPVYKKWWFWTAVGVVAVGGGVAAYAATRSDPTTGALDVHFMVP